MSSKWDNITCEMLSMMLRTEEALNTWYCYHCCNFPFLCPVPRGNFYFLIYIFSIFLQWIGIIVVMKQTDKIVISFLWCQIPSLAVNFVRHSTTNGMHVDSVLSRSLADTHNDHTRLPDAPLHQNEYLLSTAPQAATASLSKLWEKTSLPSQDVKMIHSSF